MSTTNKYQSGWRYCHLSLNLKQYILLALCFATVFYSAYAILKNESWILVKQLKGNIKGNLVHYNTTIYKIISQKPAAISAQTSLKPAAILKQTSVLPTAILKQTSLLPKTILKQTSVLPKTILKQTSVLPTAILKQTSVLPTAILKQTSVLPTAILKQTSVLPTAILNQTSVLPAAILNQTSVQTTAALNKTVFLKTATTLKKSTFIPKTTKESPQKLRDLFQDRITKNEIAIYMTMMKKFTSACEKLNVTYMIIWGTLLGSYRHHGFVPWDDDFDVIVNRTRRDDIKQVVQIMGKEYILDTSQGVRWKIYHKMDSWPTKRVWRWPFLDISFYKTSKTHIYDTATDAFTKKLEDVFPLKKRYFEGEYFWAPKTFRASLGSAADMQECCTRSWNHREEYWMKAECRACNSLYEFQPFVFRRDLGNGVIAEDLFKGGKWIHTIKTEDIK